MACQTFLVRCRSAPRRTHSVQARFEEQVDVGGFRGMGRFGRESLACPHRPRVGGAMTDKLTRGLYLPSHFPPRRRPDPEGAPPAAGAENARSAWIGQFSLSIIVPPTPGRWGYGFGQSQEVGVAVKPALCTLKVQSVSLTPTCRKLDPDVPEILDLTGSPSRTSARC
jgi:hypothetical protein